MGNKIPGTSAWCERIEDNASANGTRAAVKRGFSVARSSFEAAGYRPCPSATARSAKRERDSAKPKRTTAPTEDVIQLHLVAAHILVWKIFEHAAKFVVFNPVLGAVLTLGCFEDFVFDENRAIDAEGEGKCVAWA